MRSVILFDAIGVWFLFIFSRFNLKQFMRWFALRFGFLLNFVGFWFLVVVCPWAFRNQFTFIFGLFPVPIKLCLRYELLRFLVIQL